MHIQGYFLGRLIQVFVISFAVCGPWPTSLNDLNVTEFKIPSGPTPISRPRDNCRGEILTLDSLAKSLRGYRPVGHSGMATLPYIMHRGIQDVYSEVETPFRPCHGTHRSVGSLQREESVEYLVYTFGRPTRM